MQKEEDAIFAHLLANPYYHKKKTIGDLSSIDDELFSLLNRKIPTLNITEGDYFLNIQKIESLFVETNNNNIIKNVIEQIINYIINEEVLF